VFRKAIRGATHTVARPLEARHENDNTYVWYPCGVVSLLCSARTQQKQIKVSCEIFNRY